MKPQNGIDRLRSAVRLFGSCRESFLERFTANQLLKLHTAWRRATHDYSPDLWTPEQVRDALRGGAPTWDASGRPGRSEFGPCGCGVQLEGGTCSLPIAHTGEHRTRPAHPALPWGSS